MPKPKNPNSEKTKSKDESERKDERKTLRVTQEVYDKIYSMGKMGDTADSVLRRLLGL